MNYVPNQKHPLYIGIWRIWYIFSTYYILGLVHTKLFVLFMYMLTMQCTYVLVAVRSSGILKVKQKLGVTFNFDKQDVIDFYEIFKNDNLQGLRSKFIKVVVDHSVLR